MNRADLGCRAGLLFALFAAAGCSDDPAGPDPGDPGTGGPGTGGAAVVIVDPSTTRLTIGQSTSLTAEVRDSADAVIDDAVVTWSSDAPSVASVDANGLVTALDEGSATITASSGPASGDAGVSVEIVTVCECAVIIDSTNLSLVSRDSASGRFEFVLVDGRMPDIDTTSVIVGAQDEGFLRHVNGIERSGNSLVLQTSQAGLANVIENGGFGGSTRIFAEDDGSQALRGAGDGNPNVVWGETQIIYMADGVEQMRPGALRLSGLKLQPGASQGGDDVVPVEFEFEVVDGALNFGPTLDLGASISAGGLDEFHAIYTGGLSLTASSDEAKPLVWSVGISKELTLAEAEQTLLTLRKPFIFWAGYVPITGVLLFTVKAKAAVTASGAIKYEGDFGAGFELSAGARYSGGNWSPVFGTSTRWDGAPPPPLEGLSGEVEAKVSFTVQPELFLKFYYIAGPFVNVQPTLEAPAQLSIPGFDWFTRVDYVTKLALGGRAEILRKQPTSGVTAADLLNLEFAATIPLHRPVILAEMYSRGPLVVTDTTTGDDLDDFYDVELTPAFNVNEPLIGLRHTTSTSTITDSPPGERRVFSDVRSGESFAHRIRLTDVAGNCTVQNDAAYDTVGVRSNLRIATPGIADHDTARVAINVECIPLGAVRVATLTTGPDQDPDGYRLALTRIDTVGTSRKWFDDDDGGAGAAASASADASATADGPPISTAGEVMIDSLIPKNPDPRSRATGEHRFALDGVRENCAVARPAAHEEVALSGDTLFTNFEVRCIELGGVSVRTSTIDPDPPPASEPLDFSARVLREGTLEDSVRVELGPNDTATVEDRIPLYSESGSTGRHLVELGAVGGLPDRCALAGASPRTVTVLSGETAAVGFDVECVERLHVRTRTFGPETDPDGYVVVVEPEAMPSDTMERPIGTDETIGIAGTAAGLATVRLEGVAPTCMASVAAIEVDIGARDSTLVSFEIDCPDESDAVRDSVIYPIDDIDITSRPGELEAELGTFVVPPHLSAYGVEVSVDLQRSDGQPDEAFALGTASPSGPVFIGPDDCPVVLDTGPSVRDWVPVGAAELSVGGHEFVARHAVEFDCYDPVGDLSGPNSVHFHGLKLVFLRSP